jgi:hypothetical protein
MFLIHMTKVGVLLWLNEPLLKDCVVIDPMKALIKPSSFIIRKLQQTGQDPTVHMSDLHRECARLYPEEFKDMRDTGIVSGNILTFLLSRCQDADVSMVVQLMIRYSLMVPVVATPHSEGGNISGAAPLDATDFVVPALLPIQLSQVLQGQEWSRNSWHTAIIFFSTSSSLHRKSTLAKSELEDGFNPPDLFTLLLAKLLSYSNRHKPKEFTNHLSQYMVVL